MTPNIDALAAEGVRFDNGYAGNAVCAPSRAISMTGRYNTRFGYEFTPFPKIGVTIIPMDAGSESRVPYRASSTPKKLMRCLESTRRACREARSPPPSCCSGRGYYTAHIGKWHLGSEGDMAPNQQGFDESLELSGLLYLPEAHPDVVNQKFPRDGTDPDGVGPPENSPRASTAARSSHPRNT